MGVPEMVQLSGERTSPAGRLMLDVNSHDVITVPPVQAIVIGVIGREIPVLSTIGGAYLS